MVRGVVARRMLVLVVPVAAIVATAFVPGVLLAPAHSNTTISLPPETTIPDTTVPAAPPTTIPECVYVVVSTTSPPPTSVRVCPWP